MLPNHKKIIWLILVIIVILGCDSSLTKPAVPVQAGKEPEAGSNMFFSSHEEKHEHKERKKSLELVTTLKKLHSVKDISVHLTLADTSILSKDKNKKSRAVVLVVSEEGSQPSQKIIRDIIAEAIDDINPDSIKIHLTKDKTKRVKLVDVGPVQVTVSSAKKVKIIFGVLFGMCILLSIGLILAGIKLKRSK